MKARLFSELRHLLRPIEVRIANAIARAVVDRIDDSTKLQTLQLGVLDGEDVDDAERFAEYGFTSVPLPGAEAVVVFPNGDRAHPLVVAVDDRAERPTGLASGEAMIYSTHGQTVYLKADGSVEITGTELRLADANATDPIIRKSDLDVVVNKLNSHTHVTTATVSTGAPGEIAAIDPPLSAPGGSTKVKSG